MHILPYSLKYCLGRSTQPTALTSTPSSSSSSPQTDPTRKVVHFIHIFREPLALHKGLQFDFPEYLAIRSAIFSLQSAFIFLDYVFVQKNGDASSKMPMDPMSNPWIRRLRNKMLVIEHQLRNVKGLSTSHLIGVMSLQLPRDNGGTFLDLNTFVLKRLAPILDPPSSQAIVLGYEGGNRRGLGKGAMAVPSFERQLAHHIWDHGSAGRHLPSSGGGTPGLICW
ncbi:hypothetical protein E4U42_000731 [Claviceps africana]|uniref:Uncharacterized protein n=1 Tax=Claviceps africana TaxID=83212 RepID=A0A8K0J532_9HYPO|nr:hypothetical protein E4U42_000731 [Claviceps africana]